MHICKFSYLKGSIRVTLSWWQLKGLQFLYISQRLINNPVAVMCYGGTCLQVENCMNNITHIKQCTNTECGIGLSFSTKSKSLMTEIIDLSKLLYCDAVQKSFYGVSI